MAMDWKIGDGGDGERWLEQQQPHHFSFTYEPVQD